ncbi:Outer kinetochore duo1 [Hyphodiscus hymeniophilus]|uniref:DASH complex subunit DUO1 n=1 Tax=Hyphodiscus hymeniophilus TaxID=353542 RepID=A0A9P6VLI9_9HELO|nr:Outer kinetochore duo1 [Hyphodiscus hymeniophilus]
MVTPDIEKLDLSDSDTEDLFASPSRASKPAQKSTKPTEPAPRKEESKYDAEQARDASLQRELESVRSINDVIEGVVNSLECAKGNMDTVSRTVSSASTLLNTWIRILSQTEHNQRLILNPNWKGASADLADMENEVVLKAQASERRAAEEERRREDARRRAEDEERQRQAGTTVRGARGTRGRGRGGRGISGTGYVAGGSNSTTSSRGTSQNGRGGTSIGRGFGSVRGKARGVR